MTVLIAALSMFTADAQAFDHSHAAFAAVLDGAVSDAGVDYGLIAKRGDQLDAYLKEVANAPVSSFSRDQKLAFYINAYNALTVNLIVDNNQPASIRDLAGGKVWDAEMFSVGQTKMTLNDIEHKNVRRLGDGRIHAAVNCASAGCPPLPPKPVTPNGISGQLDAAAKRWIRVNAFDIEGSAGQLSKIFLWYGGDFSEKSTNAMSEEEKFAAGRAFITKYGGDLSKATTFEWNAYDWSLNKR